VVEVVVKVSSQEVRYPSLLTAPVGQGGGFTECKKFKEKREV